MTGPVDDVPREDGLTGEDTKFLGQVLAANASWSAAIHEAALDGQERQAAEWADRYQRLHGSLERILCRAPLFLRDTVLYNELCSLAADTGFLADLAGERVQSWGERALTRAAEKEERRARASSA